MKKKKVTAPVKGRPSIASLLVQPQKPLESARKCREQRKRPLTIPRTVEMVEQESEEWRSEKSQLIFMTAIGLTPKACWKGNVPLCLNVEEHFPNQTSSSLLSNRETNAGVELADDDCVLIIDDPNQKSSYSNSTKIKAGDEVDDECVCVGVFKHLPIDGFPKIKLFRFSES